MHKLKVLLLSFLITFNLNSVSLGANNFWPTQAEWRDAFWSAAESPLTWVPLVGAAAIVVTNSDKSITNWATDHYYLFGSEKNANRQSTNLQYALGIMAVTSLLFAPQRDPNISWGAEKGKYLLVLTGAYGAAVGTTGVLKLAVGRERPNGHDTRSFPSGHMTSAFSTAALISTNLDSYPISRTTDMVAKAGVYLLTFGVGWGRIEAKAHYASDVLVGAAIGNFFTSAIYNAFMNKPTQNSFSVSVAPVKRGMFVSIDKNLA